MIEQNLRFSTGRKIKMMRLAQKLTQEELALGANICAKYLSLIETDRREASVYVYRGIAKALNAPLWLLFCDLSEGLLLTLKHFDDCSEAEIRVLRRFIDGNKYAIRQCRDLGVDLDEKNSY